MAGHEGGWRGHACWWRNRRVGNSSDKRVSGWRAGERRGSLTSFTQKAQVWSSSCFLFLFRYFCLVCVGVPDINGWLGVGIEDHILVLSLLTSRMLWWCSNAFILFFYLVCWYWFGSILSKPHAWPPSVTST